MNYRMLPMTRESALAQVAWYAACVSVILALAAFLPTLPLRALVVTAGLALAFMLARLYLARRMPFSAAVVTAVAFFCSVGIAARLAGLPLSRGFSGAGEVGQSTAWHFNAAVLCLGTGVLAAGLLVAQAGSRRGELRGVAYLLASTLPVICFAGCAVLALCPVGGTPALAKAHFVGTWAALGAFWCAMAASTLLRGLSRPLRYYSLVASVLAFGISVPTGLYQLHLIGPPSLPIGVEELVHFTAYFAWGCWLALEWSPPLSG